MRCAEEFPLLWAAEKKYANEGLRLLFIGHQDRIEKLDKYAKQYGIRDYLFDPDDSVSRKFGMTYGGGVVFINREAVVKARIPKGISATTVEEQVRKIL